MARNCFSEKLKLCPMQNVISASSDQVGRHCVSQGRSDLPTLGGGLGAGVSTDRPPLPRGHPGREPEDALGYVLWHARSGVRVLKLSLS